MIVNGVTLPDLPETWYAQHFIIVATTDSEQTLYKALMGVEEPRDFYYIPKEITGASYSAVSPLVSSMGYAQCTVGATEWDIPTLGVLHEPISVGDIDGVTTEVVWSNHDIYEVTSVNAETGEITTGDIYFPNSEAEQEPEEEPKPERVSIAYTLFDEIAREAQRLSDTTEKMNAIQVRDKLKAVEKGIVLPENAGVYYISTAKSTLELSQLNFESSAVGVLQE